MAIGKPLLVNQRRDIERPVMSAQTQQLSSNVPVQKLAMLDYSIGQANTKASFAVTDELRGLVDAGVQAKLYMDNTKREYERLNLMEDWQKSNMDFQGRFAQARTPEAQATVIADYENDTQNRIGTYTKSQGNGAKQLAQLADLRNTANTQFSKFSVTHQNNLFKQTAGMLSTDTATIAQSVAEDVNVDPVSAFKKIADNYGEMVAIGALDAPTAQYQQRQLQDKMITGRSTLFAQNYAKEATATGQYPTDAEFSNRMEGVMGLKLSDRRLKLLKESFTDSYFKEMGETNREIAAQETFALRITEEGRLQLKEEVNQAIIDGAVGPVETERLIKKAHTFDKAKPGFGLAVEKQLRDAKHGTAYQPYVAHFTTGQGRDVIMETIKASGTSYFDLAELRSHLETMGGKYQGMNESTIQGILKHWRGINDSTSKGLLDQGPEVMQTTLMTMIKKGSKRPEWLSDETMTKLEVSGMLSKMADPMHLNWSKTMQFSKAHSRAWNITLADLAAEKKNEQGVFSPKNLSQPADTQRAMLENYVEQLLEKNFSQSVNEELSKKAEKIESAKQQKAEKAKKDALTFSMESIGDGESTTPTTPTVGKTPPALKLIEKQVAKKRIRNAQYSNTFRDQLQKGDVSGAMGTAIASKYVDVTQAFRDAHEQSKLTYGKSPMNEYNAHLGEMAEVSKNINKELSSGIWEKLSKAVGQGEPITLDGLANDMGLLVGTLGNRLIDGMENHAIEKTPITDIKRKQETTPDPRATPQAPDSTVPSTAGDDLAQGIRDNPIVQNIVGSINDLLGGSATTAEAATTGQRVVQSGDTMSAIAREAGIPLPELLALNTNLSDPNNIKVGQSITVPQSVMQQEPDLTSPVTVQSQPSGAAQANLSSLPLKHQATVSWKLNQVRDQSTAETIMILEGHQLGSEFQKKGEQEGPYGISLANFNQYTQQNYKVGDAPTDAESKIAYDAHMQKVVMPIITDLESHKVVFTDNEKRAMMSLLWNGAKGSKTLKAIAPNAYKAFKDGDKATAFEELFSRQKGIRKGAGGKVIPGLVNRRAIEWALATDGQPQASTPTTLEPSLASAVLPTAPKLYAKAMAGDRGIWKEDTFSGEEQAQLKDIVAEKIKKGNFLISYSDYDEEAGSKIGYGMEAPDSSQGLKFSLGQARIVRHGDKIMVADEWDIDSPEKINEMPVMDRMATLFEKVKSGDTSMYGFAHLIGEAFGPQSGEGASIRATIGTAKSLNLSKAQLAKIPQLKQYEAENKHRINPENLGKFA